MKFGFIGCGNMANAIIGGILKAGKAKAEEIIGSCPTKESRERAAEQLGIAMTGDNREVVQSAEVIFLCVKPMYLADVIAESRDLTSGKLFVSIVAGRSLAMMEETFADSRVKLVRLMPNTPALVGEAMTAVCANGNVSREELETVLQICKSFGEAQIVPERLFDAVTGVSGSSPAYIFMLIEAMADAAVQGGMPRQQAYTFAAQAVLGSAKMVLETGKHPGELKDMVTSPAGTTIEAVRVLEAKGFRSAVFECVKACTEKSIEMGKQSTTEDKNGKRN